MPTSPPHGPQPCPPSLLLFSWWIWTAEKYPDENAYNEYLSDNGGNSNAFTSDEVKASSLYGAALDLSCYLSFVGSQILHHFQSAAVILRDTIFDVLEGRFVAQERV